MLMYGGRRMERSGIDLEERQLAALRAMSTRTGRPVAVLVREAVDHWLATRDAPAPEDDAWARRFAALLERRGRLAEARGWPAQAVDADVARAIAEVRRSHPARRP